MVIGITMLKVMPGHERSVYHNLKSRDDIKDIYHVFGEYDFFVIMQADGISRINKIVENIRDLYDVTTADNVLIGRDGDAIGAEAS
jgi:uncharacterized protein with GYD domain